MFNFVIQLLSWLLHLISTLCLTYKLSIHSCELLARQPIMILISTHGSSCQKEFSDETCEPITDRTLINPVKNYLSNRWMLLFLEFCTVRYCKGNDEFFLVNYAHEIDNSWSLHPASDLYDIRSSCSSCDCGYTITISMTITYWHFPERTFIFSFLVHCGATECILPL